MQRRIFQFAILLLWLSLPLVAVQYTQVWDQLPMHVATHFNAANQANGWMPRVEAIRFAVGFMAFLLTVFTVILLYIARVRVDAFAWATLGFCAVVLGVMVEVNRSIVNYNLHGVPLQLGAVLIAVPIAVILLIAVYIASRRGPELPSHELLASELLVEETHSGPVCGLVMLIGVLGLVTALALVPAPAIRWPMVAVGLVMLGAAAMAWSGFHYRFLQHGVEIRTLGFRLRSIPRQSIVGYSIEPWSLVRGYGIRGVGNSRAYVWGNKVIHIKTSNGDVFLGHNDPQRIVRDLDRVMRH